MSALCNLFTWASSHIVSAFFRTTSNFVPACYPKPWYFYSLFWDIDVFLNNLPEYIKAFSVFIFTPLSFHGRETQLIYWWEMSWKMMVSFLPGHKTNLGLWFLLTWCIRSSSWLDFKEMVPISQFIFLCNSTREKYSWIYGTIWVVLYLTADNQPSSLLSEIAESHSFPLYVSSENLLFYFALKTNSFE